MREMSMLRIELKIAEENLVGAVMLHAEDIKEMIKESVEAYCHSSNLKSVIDGQAKDCINEVIKDEMQRFFRYGDGRKAVKEAVAKMLEDADENTSR